MPDELTDWREALAAGDPVARLRAVVRQRLAGGQPRERIVEELTRLVHSLRAQQRPDEEEEPILDVLDMLSGWCAPGAAL